jgi:hypothetical protein
VLVLGFRRCTRSLEGRSAGQNLAGDGDDAAGRVVAGGGEEQILGFVVRVLGLWLCKESLERERIRRREWRSKRREWRSWRRPSSVKKRKTIVIDGWRPMLLAG